MHQIKINLLGIGGIQICSEQKTIYIDAFSCYVPPFDIERADLILITHADEDHFGYTETAQAARQTGAHVLGPTSIAYPLLAGEHLPPEQLDVFDPIHITKPIAHCMNGLKVKVYNTRHFNDWEPAHVSYLIKLLGKKIYIAGDSYHYHPTDPDLEDLDVLIGNLITPGNSPEESVAHTVEAIEALQPRYFLANHLIDCAWTITPQAYATAIEQQGLENVVVLKHAQQSFGLE